MSDDQPSVFISYSTKDRDLAKRLHDDLREMGANVFQFEESATPGMPAWKEVIEAIDKADWFVVLLTQAAVESKPVDAEIEHAHHRHLNRGRPGLVPALVEAGEKPPLLARLTTLPFHDYAAGLDALARQIGVPRADPPRAPKPPHRLAVDAEHVVNTPGSPGQIGDANNPN